MKKKVLGLLGGSPIVDLFRFLNRSKVLILAYHGVSAGRFVVAPATQIPLGVFRDQVRFLAEKYRTLSLGEVVRRLRDGRALPPNTAVVTFDDGYRNNATEAFPVLSEHGVPSTIFLTVDYIGTDRMLPFDRCWILLDELRRGKGVVSSPRAGVGILDCGSIGGFQETYRRLSSFLKDLRTEDQHRLLDEISRDHGIDMEGSPHRGDFSLLSWEEVKALSGSGIVEFGSHTLSHEILRTIPHGESLRQIRESRERIRERTGMDVDLFAYPNGEAGDFDRGHMRCLAGSGYAASVTTLPRLNRRSTDPYALGRMIVGPGYTMDEDHFRLSTSGVMGAMRAIRCCLPN